MEIFLDGMLIFRGEIARACGAIQGSTDAFGDVSKSTTTPNHHRYLIETCHAQASLLFSDYFVYN